MESNTGPCIRGHRPGALPRSRHPGTVLIASLLALGGCVQTGDRAAFEGFGSYARGSDPGAELVSLIPEDKINTAARERAAAAIAALDRGEFGAASLYVNQALKMDIRNPYLQFLNGYIYHRRALAGDAESFPLAEQGYRLAIDFDRSNWLAHYYLGQYYLDLRNYAQAQEAFASAAFYQPDNRDVLYKLAKASYYAGDPAVSSEALDRIVELEEAPVTDPRLLQGLAIVNAAANRPDDADRYLAGLESSAASPAVSSMLHRRLDDWEDFHRAQAARGAEVRLAQAGPSAVDEMNRMPDAGAAPGGFELPPEPAQDPYAQPPAAAAGIAPATPDPFAPGADPLAGFAETEMVIVDVVIIQTEEDINNSAGVNLLSGLTIQFGDPLTGTPAFGYERENTKDFLDSFGSNKTRTITRAIQIPAISYSLNIANANRAENQVLAKPTLVALAGETSQFFSGVDVAAAAVSGAAGDSVSIDREIGVKLEVTPEILPEDMVKLRVFAERTFLTQPSQSVVFQFRLDTTKTSVNATVALKFGETLILSGLSERELENNRDGVPGLQDVPLIQYAFSRQTKRSFDKSVLILLTPRRPQYTHRTDAGKPAAGAAQEETGADAVDRLAERNGDWFRPDPTINGIFRRLESNVLYEEFRQGDFAIEDWQAQPENRDRLKATINWLYF